MIKARILFIDDEENLCRMVKLNLESTREFEVTTALSGRLGLEAAKEKEFDLVITDFRMPAVDGKVVLDTLKKTKPDLPVILFSIWHDDPSVITDSTKDKADALIGKPFEHDELHKTIKEVLARKKEPTRNPSARFG